VYNAGCSLLFHGLGIENVCEGAPLQQGIFNMIKCMGTLRVSFRSKCFFSLLFFYQRLTWRFETI